MPMKPEPGALAPLIRSFMQASCKDPEKPTPGPWDTITINRMIVTHGLLTIITIEAEVIENRLLPFDNVSKEEWEKNVPQLARAIADFYVVPHYTEDLQDYILGGGVLLNFDGPTLRIFPLKEGVGEMDQQPA